MRLKKHTNRTQKIAFGGSLEDNSFQKMKVSPGCMAQLERIIPRTKRLLVRVPVRAHAWVVVLILSRGVYRKQLIDVSLSY